MEIDDLIFPQGIQPGAQIFGPNGSGTIGNVVEKNGQAFVITAGHVMKNSNTRFHYFKNLDLAVIPLNHELQWRSKLRGFSTQIGNAIPLPAEGTRVFKIGAKTGLTNGVVSVSSEDRFYIRPGVQFQELTLPGDSGSFWLKEGTFEFVGMHVAGEKDPDPAKEISAAVPSLMIQKAIDSILDKINEQLVTLKLPRTTAKHLLDQLKNQL